MTSPPVAPTRDWKRQGQVNPVQPAGSRKAHVEEPGRRGEPRKEGGTWEEGGTQGGGRNQGGGGTQGGGPLSRTGGSKASPELAGPCHSIIAHLQTKDSIGLLCFVDFFALNSHVNLV